MCKLLGILICTSVRNSADKAVPTWRHLADVASLLTLAERLKINSWYPLVAASLLAVHTLTLHFHPFYSNVIFHYLKAALLRNAKSYCDISTEGHVRLKARFTSIQLGIRHDCNRMYKKVVSLNRMWWESSFLAIISILTNVVLFLHHRTVI
jgi:hypothetical protein